MTAFAPAEGRQWQRRPEARLALGFRAVILMGAALLSLPAAARDGRSIGLTDSLFTATSAVCVTGLVSVDTGTTFSPFGQIVLFVLIQVVDLPLSWPYLYFRIEQSCRPYQLLCSDTEIGRAHV